MNLSNLKILLLLLSFSVLNTHLFAKEKIPETANDVTLPMAKDLSVVKTQSQNNHKILLLYIAATDCPFCKQLEKDVLIPMLRNVDYQGAIVLYKVNLDSQTPLIDFNAQLKPSSKFASELNAKVTPTLLFLSSAGVELTSRLVGYQGNEFYWYQLDQKLERAKSGLTAKKNN